MAKDEKLDAQLEAALRVGLARASLLEFMADQKKAGAVDERIATAFNHLKIASALLNPER